MRHFKTRWGITTNFQLGMILISFALTGTSSMLITKKLLLFFNIENEVKNNLLFYILKLGFVLILYQFLLVIIGALLGQFQFFWKFEKQLLTKMGFGFGFLFSKVKKNDK